MKNDYIFFFEWIMTEISDSSSVENSFHIWVSYVYSVCKSVHDG